MKRLSFEREIHVRGEIIQDLFAKEYEDPRDSVYLNALKLNKSFDKATKLAIEYGIERIETIKYTGSNVRVTAKNMPYIYECVETACSILNVQTIPDVYVCDDPHPNAFTTGSAHPILVLHNSILQRMTHEELMFIIGHEIGHIKSEHVQYKLIGGLMLQLGNQFMDTTLLGSLIATGLNIAFYEWERCAEFTSDHAGLLVCQDLRSAITALAKLGGYPLEYYDTLDADGFLEQANQFTGFDDGVYNKVVKTYLTLSKTHPWTVLRARELMLWVQSGEYSRIIKRCSSWLEKEIERLTANTDKAVERHEKEKIRVDIMNRQVEENNVSAEDIPIGEKKGIQYIWAKGQSGIKTLQSQMNEGEKRRKQENVNEAKKVMEAAGKEEKKLRELYCSVQQADLDEHTSVVIGKLSRIE